MFDDIFSRHERIALQFSSGKDSLACLYLLQPYWHRLTVYHLDSGDAFPETRRIADQVRSEVPNFIEVAGRTKQVHQAFGIPSDVVPTSSTRVGFDMGAHTNELIVDRYLCCFLSIMNPMHERMEADGITLIIRGQKNSDISKAGTRSGNLVDGIELLYPLQNWSDAQVFQFLRHKDIQVSPVYDELKNMPDCMSCSAWWEEGRAAYLKKRHPESYVIYQDRLAIIEKAVNRHIVHFKREANFESQETSC